MNSKIFLQAENVKNAVFASCMANSVQDMATVEGIPAELKQLLRGISEITDGLRDLLDDVQRHIDELPDDSVIGEEIEDC